MSLSSPQKASRIPQPANHSSLQKRPPPLDFYVHGETSSASKRVRHSISSTGVGFGGAGGSSVHLAGSRWGVNLRNVGTPGTFSGGANGAFGSTTMKEVSFSFDKENLGRGMQGGHEGVRNEEFNKRLKNMEEELFNVREEKRKEKEELDKLKSENKRLQNLIGVQSYATTSKPKTPPAKRLNSVALTPQASNNSATDIMIQKLVKELYNRCLKQQTQIKGLELRIMASKMYGRRLLEEFNSRKGEEKGVEEDWEMEVSFLERQKRIAEDAYNQEIIKTQTLQFSVEVLQNELETMAGKIEDLQSQNELSLSQAQEHKSIAAKHLETLSSLKSAHAELQQAHDALEVQLSQMQSQVRDQSVNGRAVDRRISEVRDEEKEKFEKELQKERKTWEKERLKLIKEWKEEKKEVEERVETLEEEKKLWEEEMEELKDRVKEAKKEAKAQTETLERKWEASQADLRTARSKIGDLRNQMKALRQAQHHLQVLPPSLPSSVQKLSSPPAEIEDAMDVDSPLPVKKKTSKTKPKSKQFSPARSEHMDDVEVGQTKESHIHSASHQEENEEVEEEVPMAGRRKPKSRVALEKASAAKGKGRGKKDGVSLDVEEEEMPFRSKKGKKKATPPLDSSGEEEQERPKSKRTKRKKPQPAQEEEEEREEQIEKQFNQIEKGSATREGDVQNNGKVNSKPTSRVKSKPPVIDLSVVAEQEEEVTSGKNKEIGKNKGEGKAQDEAKKNRGKKREREAEGDGTEEGNLKGPKKAKVKLFGGKLNFNWGGGTGETDALGIPMALSPVKTQPKRGKTPGGSTLGGWGSVGGASIFSRG